MIDKKELRAGNIVNVPHGDVAIDFLMQEGVHLVDDCGGNWQSLEPVPLSHEWIHRFNGEISKTVGGYEAWDFPNRFRLLDGKHPAFQYYRPVQYVHQLQNLYFALTGQELILKP